MLDITPADSKTVHFNCCDTVVCSLYSGGVSTPVDVYVHGSTNTANARTGSAIATV